MNYKEEMALRHFGVPGMKWGKRKGPSERTLARRADNKKNGGYVKNYGKALKNQILHPIRSTVAASELAKKTGAGATFRRNVTGFHSKNELRAFNQSVDKMIKDKKSKGKRLSGKQYIDAVVVNLGHAAVASVATTAVTSIGRELIRSSFDN